MTTHPALPIRAYLLHITHYDPAWLRDKGFAVLAKPLNLAELRGLLERIGRQ